MLPSCIREVCGSNLDQDTNYPDLRFIVVFPRLSMHILGECLNLGRDCFQPHLFQFTVHYYLVIRRCLYDLSFLMKSVIFWDTTPCSPLCCIRRFGGTYRLHLQGRKISSANQRASRWQAVQLNGLHGVISQKMILFITTAMKTSNPTFFLFLGWGET
jgi:hypothetical protein